MRAKPFRTSEAAPIEPELPRSRSLADGQFANLTPPDWRGPDIVWPPALPPEHTPYKVK